jgi:hypothetical protein
MPLTGILINLGLLVSLIVGLVMLKYTGALDVVLHALGWMRDTLGWLMHNRIFQLFMFIFLIAVGGTAVTLFLGLQYACTSDDQLRTQRWGIPGGVVMMVVGMNEQFNGTNNVSYDSFIGNWTVAVDEPGEADERNVMGVGCTNQNPKFLLFNKVNILDYRMWLLILMLTGIVTLLFRLRRT